MDFEDAVKTRQIDGKPMHDIEGYPDGVKEQPMLRLDAFIQSALDHGHEFVQEFSPDSILVWRGKPHVDLSAMMHS